MNIYAVPRSDPPAGGSTTGVHPRRKSTLRPVVSSALLRGFIRVVVGMVALVLLVSPFFVLHPAFAGDFGLGATAEKAGIKGREGTPGAVQEIIGQFIGIALSFVGVIFLILLIYGGFAWMIGGKEGKEGEVNKAKKIISAAIVGLVLVFGAYAITSFVTGQLGTAFGIK